MREQDLQIHLRRRYVEQAQARRPRLPQRLRALGAVGPVLRLLPAHSQQAFVQVRVTNVSTTGRHLSYLTHAKGPARQDATLFGPAAAATRRFVQEAQHDPHQFRLLVSVPDHARLDRTRYIALYMAQVGHPPGCTRGTKPAPLATEGQQQLLRARVTAQAQQAIRQDAALQVGVQLPLDRRGQAGGLGVGVQRGEKGFEMVGNHGIDTTWKVMSQISDALKNLCCEIKDLRKWPRKTPL
jgi:hypothetical protein